jgi:rhodanese-related sulfurtransferase
LVICRKRRPTCSIAIGVMSKLQALYLKEKGFANVKVYRP